MVCQKFQTCPSTNLGQVKCVIHMSQEKNSSNSILQVGQNGVHDIIS